MRFYNPFAVCGWEDGALLASVKKKGRKFELRGASAACLQLNPICHQVRGGRAKERGGSLGINEVARATEGGQKTNVLNSGDGQTA